MTLQDFTLQQLSYTVNGETEYRYGFYFASEAKTPGSVLKNTWYTALDFSRMVWMGLADLISGAFSIREMSGPVGIVSVIAQTGESSASVADGLMNVFYLGAFIAVNLAIMNMLPIPALDGGRVFLLLVTWVIERITKKRLDPKYEGYIHAAGMVLLLALMAYVMFNDIVRIVTK